MELRHLRYFIAAAEEEHFGRAADRLCITRPAVSQLVADLEAELGTPLFQRLAHRVKLTAAGHTLLPRLQSVMKDLNEALLLAGRVGQGKTGTLNIGYGTLTLLHKLFRATIKRYCELYPDVALSLFEMSTTDQPKALAEGKIHAGFMHFGPGRTLLGKHRSEDEVAQDTTVLDWIRIQSGGLGVAMSAENPLASKGSATLADLAQEPFVVVPRSSSSPGYGPLHALCLKAGFEPNVVQEVSTIAVQLNLIAIGMGVGLLPTGKNFEYHQPGLAVVPLDEVIYPTTFVFAWVKGQKDPALDRMIELIAELSK
jgi:DNA-binding transcriptional LysR family regulator